MNSAAVDIAKFLATEGVGTLPHTTGWAVSAALEPVSPDDAVTVYDTGGEGPDTDDGDEAGVNDLHESTVQVRTRSADYSDAYDKQTEIFALLTSKSVIETETSNLVGVFMTTDVLPIGRDDNNRHLLVANYRIIRTEKE